MSFPLSSKRKSRCSSFCRGDARLARPIPTQLPLQSIPPPEMALAQMVTLPAAPAAEALSPNITPKKGCQNELPDGLSLAGRARHCVRAVCWIQAAARSESRAPPDFFRRWLLAIALHRQTTGAVPPGFRLTQGDWTVASIASPKRIGLGTRTDFRYSVVQRSGRASRGLTSLSPRRRSLSISSGSSIGMLGSFRALP